MFIESVCDDKEIIFANIREVKLSSPDYASVKDADAAVHDFMLRIAEYEKTYETIDEADISYVKMINTGSQFVIHLVQDYLQSRIVFYLMNLHIRPRTICKCNL